MSEKVVSKEREAVLRERSFRDAFRDFAVLMARKYTERET